MIIVTCDILVFTVCQFGGYAANVVHQREIEERLLKMLMYDMS